MADKNISVDEILQELQLKKAKSEKSKPQSNLDHVNTMIEQIITQKKEEQIRKDNIELTDKEKESLEKEIKAQTRTIGKLYEQMEKANTRQLKKQLREERAVERELHIKQDEAKQPEPQKMQNDEPLKFATVHPNQKVRVTSSFEKLQSDEKQEKLNELKQTAHNDHIKRELKNITAHFGSFKTESKNPEDRYSKLGMDEKNYKEYKKNRNKKIEKFVLQEEPFEQPVNKQLDTPAKVVTAELEEEKAEVQPIIEQSDAQLSNNPVEIELEQDEIIETPVVQKEEPIQTTSYSQEDEEDDAETEYTDASQNESITNELNKHIKSFLARITGFGILSAIALVLCLFQVAGTQFSAFGMVAISPNIYVMANLALLVVAMIMAFDMFVTAAQSILYKEPATDMLYSVTALICLGANLLLLLNTSEALTKGVHLFTPIFVISLLFLYISKYMKMKMVLYNFTYIKNENGEERYGITTVDDFSVKVDMTKGIIDDEPYLVKTVKTKFFRNFFAHNRQPDASDIANSKVLLYAFITAVVAGVFTFLFSQKNLYVTVTMVSGVMVIATSFVAAIFCMFPIYDSKGILTHFKAMIPNQDALDEYSEVNSILLDAYDLFPENTVILHGIKTFSGKRIDEAIVNAASVLCESRSILSNVFLTMIANNKSLLKPVDSIKYEDLMGISAWVDNKRVLIGNRELMIQHSIAVPSKNYEQKYQEQSQEIIYLSTEGELSAAFIVGLTAEKEIHNVLQVLERNDIAIAMKSVDSCFTPATIAKLFDLDENRIKILPSRLHNTYYKEIQSKQELDAVLATNGTIESYVISTVATKKLSRCIKTGLIFNIVCILLGVLGLFGLFLTNHLNLFTNLAMLLYMGVFFIIYLFNQKSIHL